MIIHHVNCPFHRSHYEKLAQWQAMLQEMDTLQQHNTDASRTTKHVPSGSGAQVPVRSKFDFCIHVYNVSSNMVNVLHWLRHSNSNFW